MGLLVKILSFCILMIHLKIGYASENVCNTSSIDICKRNEKYANAIAETLPIKVNRYLTLSSVYANKNYLYINIIATEELTKQYNSPETDLIESTNNFIKSKCLDLPLYTEIIKHGGIVNYKLKGNTGITILNAIISKQSCKDYIQV